MWINLKNFKKEIFLKNRTLKLRGLSCFQICILTGIDENINIFLDINGLGKLLKGPSIEKLKQKIKNPTIIFSDKEETYKSFSKINNITHISIKNDNKKDKNLQKINSLHSRLKSFLRPFNGVSNIYLKLYLKWFYFLEKIKQDNNEYQMHKVWNLLLSYTLHAIF